MSQLALSFTAILPLHLSFSGTIKRLNRVFPIFTGQYAINSSLYGNSQSKRFSVIASANTGMNGGVAELSEREQELKQYMWPDKKRPRICIVGGGFGGLYTALRLDSLIWPDGKKPQVVLIDPSDRFVFKPMLYEILSEEVNEWEIAPRFSDLLASTDVQFIQDRVKLLHPSDMSTNGAHRYSCAGTVQLESDLLIKYDCQVGSCFGG